MAHSLINFAHQSDSIPNDLILLILVNQLIISFTLKFILHFYPAHFIKSHNDRPNGKRPIPIILEVAIYLSILHFMMIQTQNQL